MIKFLGKDFQRKNCLTKIRWKQQEACVGDGK